MLQIFIICLLGMHAIFGAETAVTYPVCRGRFGDCLLAYLHAKWFSFRENIPLFYEPFPESSHLVLDEAERRIPLGRALFRRIDLRQHPVVRSHAIRPLLYVCPYFPEDPWELRQSEWRYSFQVDWKDPLFREVALSMIAPKRKFPLRTLQPGRTHVALHIRDGGGYDRPETALRFPLKLPPLHFYVDGLRKMLELFPEKQLECHVFTDALAPDLLVQQVQKQLPTDAPIQFVHQPCAHLLEDFYSLFLFDIMIRPQSNFSMIPTLLKDFAVVYSPKECSIRDGVVHIDEVTVEYEKNFH